MGSRGDSGCSRSQREYRKDGQTAGLGPMPIAQKNPAISWTGNLIPQLRQWGRPAALPLWRLAERAAKADVIAAIVWWVPASKGRTHEGPDLAKCPSPVNSMHTI